ncbi:MAG TPA: DUF1634 domain-containing protein [Gemmataceae bacterium]|nr:DUF1634 domain-containing protein [Gemmataceae bacterium]
MNEPQHNSEDTRVEQTMGRLLQAGVLLAALVTAVGGAFYLAERATQERPAYDKLPPNGVGLDHPAELNSPAGVLELAFRGRPGYGLGRGLIQLGVLLLIATPVARVAFSVYVFARQRDRLYVAVTLAVLVLLLISLFAGPWLPGG